MRSLVVLVLLLATPAAAQRSTEEPFALDPRYRVTGLAESNWWAAHAVKCGLRDDAWLQRVYRRIPEEIAVDVRDGAPGDPNAGANIAAYWGAAAMARRLGELEELNPAICRDLRAGSSMWLLDLAAEGKPMPGAPRPGGG